MTTKSQTKPITMRLSEYTSRMLEAYSEKTGIKKSAVVSVALERYIREEEKRAAR